jgi:GxxExxY protein
MSEYLLYRSLSEQLLGAAFTVHNALGPRLLESVYEEAVCVELTHRGIPHARQVRYPVHYRGVLIGEYVADLVADGKILLELKSVKRLTEAAEAQTINYLKLSRLEVGYLMNFHGTRLEWKRFVNGG